MKHNTSSQRSRKAAQGRGAQISTQSPTPRCEVIKLGVDSHAAQNTFARMIDQQGIQPSQKLAPEQFLEFLRKQKALARRVVMVYEAGPYGFTLYRQAVAMGAECMVCAPERMSGGRKRVNDKLDARELCSRLDRYLAGNTKALRIVRVPSVAQEMSRRQARQRNTFLKERKRWRGRGRSLLHTLGVARPGKWWEPQRGQELMETVQCRYGPEVRQQVRGELDDYLEVLHLVQKKLDALTAELRRAGEARAAGEAPAAGEAGAQGEAGAAGATPALDLASSAKPASSATPASSAKPASGATPKHVRVAGIGPLSAELLDREIGDWNRFTNRRQVASYTGLCPGEDSSGDSQMSLSIDKHGNPRVRAILVELVWLLPRHQPGYIRLKRWEWVFKPASKASAALRKKAAVALARLLIIDLWRIRTGRMTPQEVGLRVA